MSVSKFLKIPRTQRDTLSGVKLDNYSTLWNTWWNYYNGSDFNSFVHLDQIRPELPKGSKAIPKLDSQNFDWKYWKQREQLNLSSIFKNVDFVGSLSIFRRVFTHVSCFVRPAEPFNFKGRKAPIEMNLNLRRISLQIVSGSQSWTFQSHHQFNVYFVSMDIVTCQK